jgi:hypothetical protein
MVPIRAFQFKFSGKGMAALINGCEQKLATVKKVETFY